MLGVLEEVMLVCEAVLGFNGVGRFCSSDLYVTLRAMCHTAGSIGRQKENMERVSGRAGPSDRSVSLARERDDL